MLGRWLPHALADVVESLHAIGGVMPSRAQTFERWGLANYAREQAAIEKREAQDSLSSFADAIMRL